MSQSQIKILVFALFISVVLSLHSNAQAVLDFRRIENQLPFKKLVFQVKCGSLIRYDLNEANFSISDNGQMIQGFTLSCPDPNIHCCMSVGLVVDRSGSMAWGNPSGMEGAKVGLNLFIDSMKVNCDEATLISFNSNVTVDVQMTSDTAQLKQGVSSLVPSGATAVWNAGMKGVLEVVNRGTRTCKAVIILTDGEDNASSYTPADIIDLALQNQIRVFTIGLGTSINEADLQQIANDTGAKFYLSPNPSTLTSIYREIYEIIDGTFRECSITYQPTCLNGLRHNVDLTLLNLSGCSGTPIIRTKSYMALLDSSTWQTVHTDFDSKDVVWGEEVEINLNLEESLDEYLDFTRFKILFDRSRLTLLSVSTSGMLLNGVPVSYQLIPEGAELLINQSKLIKGTGPLLSLKFKAGQPATPTFVSLSIADLSFPNSCIKVWPKEGKCLIKHLLRIVFPNGGERFCARTSAHVSWIAKGPNKFDLILSTDGGATFSHVLASNIQSSTYEWFIPDSIVSTLDCKLIINAQNSALADSSDNSFQLIRQTKITEQPVDTSACENTSVEFNVNAIGELPFQYEWQESSNSGASWINLLGETKNSLNIPNVNKNRSGSRFRAIVTSSCGSLESASAILSVVNQPKYVVQPGNLVLCSGDSAIFIARSTGENIINQLWQSSDDSGFTWKDVTNSWSDSLRIDRVDHGIHNTLYRRIILDSCQNNLISDIATLRVIDKPIFITVPHDTSSCGGSDVSFSISVNSNNVDRIIWQRSSDQGFSWLDMQNSNLDSLKLKGVSSQNHFDLFRAIISNRCGEKDTSSLARLSVEEAPKFLSQPSNQSICEGAGVYFIANYPRTLGSSIRWQVSTDYGVTFSDIAFENSDTLKLSNVKRSQDGSLFRSIISNGCGSAYSVPALLSVQENNLVFVTQPKNQDLCEGDQAVFEVYVLNASAFQWTKNGINILGSTSRFHTIANVKSSDSGDYGCIVYGACGSISSQTVKLIVSSAPSITKHPNTQTVLLDSTVSFFVNAIGKNLSYQWMKDGIPIQGATSTYYWITSVKKNDEGNYSVLISGSCGKPVISNPARLTVLTTSFQSEVSPVDDQIKHLIYPFPFKESSTIQFTLPSKMFVEIELLDFFGRVINKIVSDDFVEGTHSVKINALDLHSGLYAYKIRTRNWIGTGRFMIVK